MTQKSWWGYSLRVGHCSHLKKKKTVTYAWKNSSITIWHYIVTWHSVLNLLNNYRLTLNAQVNGRGKGEYYYIYDTEIRPCSGIKWQRRIIKYSWNFFIIHKANYIWLCVEQICRLNSESSALNPEALPEERCVWRRLCVRSVPLSGSWLNLWWRRWFRWTCLFSFALCHSLAC